MLKINSLLPRAEANVQALSARLGPSERRSNKDIDLEMAEIHLIWLDALHKEFHTKIAQHGPKKPNEFLDGHRLSIRNRCLGDGRDPKDCGRWFVKASALLISYYSLLTLNSFKVQHPQSRWAKLLCTRIPGWPCT
jgi:hypothetical protein